ncbi:MAG: PD-(D/E)XK nuclease family protein [archaeon]
MPRYSHSRLSTFEQCPLKFKYRYIDKIPVEFEKTIESFLGEIVHETLEWLYTEIKAKKIPSLDAMIEHYALKWTENFSKEIKLRENSTEKEFFEKGIRILINYYTENQPFEDITLEIEKEILISLDKEECYKIQGFIDRIAYNPKTKQYEVHDYKIANTLPQKEKIEQDRQLALYSMGVKDMFGQEQDILLVWHYLSHNKVIHSKRTEEQLEKLKKDTIELIKKIESTKEFPMNRGPLCNWCEYKKYCYGNN